MPPRKKTKGAQDLVLVVVDKEDANVVSPVHLSPELIASGDVVGLTTAAAGGGRGQRAKGVAQWSETERIVRRRCTNAFIE